VSNPFEALQLGPTASAEEVVRQAGRLRQRQPDEAAVAAIRRAVQVLTGSAEERQLHALLAFPEPCYRWPALEAFVAAHRRPPAATPTEPVPVPPLDVDELTDLLRPLIVEALAPPPLPLAPIAPTEDASEIRRQTIEGLWQALPFDPGA
jgi:hypothetical protein